ncbi:hypothetical protein KUCAC02_032755, partial [Chaenocephalus aceratus]
CSGHRLNNGLLDLSTPPRSARAERVASEVSAGRARRLRGQRGQSASPPRSARAERVASEVSAGRARRLRGQRGQSAGLARIPPPVFCFAHTDDWGRSCHSAEPRAPINQIHLQERAATKTRFVSSHVAGVFAKNMTKLQTTTSLHLKRLS